ncbi:uncharacterized protein LOC136024807 [Artemia franciscana]|uniref:Uncharacterized protein n=1 Tax=Artemia franciscana TaxID=6661 RepID=A0AA88IWU9_ARTSF|nr:hypothetical protein QYM36_008389 [Artemia franciscana]
MAFMVPLVRKDMELYPLHSERRKVRRSESQPGRSRNASESVSEAQSLATSPHQRAFLRYNQPRQGQFVRNSLRSMPSSQRTSRLPSIRSSQVSLPSSPSKLIEEGYLTRRQPKTPKKAPSENSLNKFHLRLIDRLRKSLKLTKDENESSKVPDSPTSDRSN